MYIYIYICLCHVQVAYCMYWLLVANGSRWDTDSQPITIIISVKEIYFLLYEGCS